MNTTESKQVYYQEKFRPQFHFTPEEKWMNDPNGLVYYEGEYHLFYQYHPGGTTWGPMHWGHAISQDLLHWQHLPIALTPDENGMIFSGSAVVDWNDTSGFFNGGSGLVAIFTHADTYPNSERPRQRQSIAYSLDKGRTWEMYSGNPVLSEESITDFRDPKVFWHENSKRWVMILAAGQTVRLYTSYNLIDWEFASEFGEGHGSHQGVWECPDLFQLPIDGDMNRKKWVLFLSIGDNPQYEEGSRTQYFIGDFDGTTFINENSPETTMWIDRGRDNYAGVSWSDIPSKDNRRIYIGWMSNWRYANMTPTVEWRSSMTLPRVVELKSTVNGERLVQKPIEELKSLRGESFVWKNILIRSNENMLNELESNSFEVKAEFELIDIDAAKEFGFKVCQSIDEETVIGYDCVKKELFVDRSRSGESDFHPSFAGKHVGELHPVENKIILHFFVDVSSVEVFGNDGELALTELIFPSKDSRKMAIYCKEGSVQLNSLEIHKIDSIWNK